MFKRRLALTLALVAAAFAAWAAIDWYASAPADALAQARYVGRDSCVYCHQQEANDFAGSNHDRAMEIASDESVLGDFNDVEFKRFGDTTRFFRDGKKFMVNIEGPDGKHHDYEIKYTFGVDPLQQYMVEFPDGRLQVLRESWDVNEKRWFFVAPEDAADEKLAPDDPLHWTGLAQNWNTMCADCHSTNFHKNFDLAANAYHSEYSEIDVSCESCHGPGSLHVELAESRSLFWDRRFGYGLTNTLKGADNKQQLQTCAPCHSRRTMIHDNFRPGDNYLDSFDPLLLYSGLYHADGQIKDEVYGYGSFTQSKMFAKGVKCTDCHNPHSGDLKYPGNQLCAQCHQPGKYDGVGHHHHPQAAPGAPETQCITCHMPTRTYMGIDARHDHNIRVPRPDLTMEAGTPNVCNRCHTKPEETPAWAARQIVMWYGPDRPNDPEHAAAFDAAEHNDPSAPELLRSVLMRPDTPDIVRATAINLLADFPSTPATDSLRHDALTDVSPLVRAAAVRTFPQDPNGATANLVREVAPRLKDPIRAVRIAAAHRLVESADQLADTYKSALDEAKREYIAAQKIYFDRADSHLNLANLAARLKDWKTAVDEYREAIRLEPYRTDPRGQLALIMEQLINDPKEQELARSLNATPAEVRRLREEEADLLKRDAKLVPNESWPHYRRGMLLYLLGDEDAARDELIIAVGLSPNDYQSLTALALILEKQKSWKEALAVVKRMSDLRPEAEDWRGIYVQIRREMAQEGKPPEAKPAEDSSEAKPAENSPQSKPD